MKKLPEIVLAEKIGRLIAERTKIVNRKNKQIEKCRDELEKICSHSITAIIEDNKEGGYDYVAEYNRITQCSICLKELERKTTYGGYA